MENIKNFYDGSHIDVDGNVLDPKEMNTKHVVINVASECGFTDTNYKDLKKFLEVTKNVHVYLYPCDDFGGQEPGDKDVVKAFCDGHGVLNYPNVHLMPKTILKDSELWHWLQYTNTGSTDEGYDLEAKWNFFKYLIDEEGDMWGIAYSDESLMGDDILSWVNQPS